MAGGDDSGTTSAHPGRARIPVVVHIVHRADEQITDEQVRGRLDVLNRDFAVRVGPLGPAAGTGLGTAGRLEFVLASTDPAGRPTTGITRTRTDVACFDDDDRVKSRATGGADAWPADRYLNIWVCELGGGLLGYAQSPGGPAETDGVVVTHTGFGTTGTATALHDPGRTTTGEVARYLGLCPEWGDDEPLRAGEPAVGPACRGYALAGPDR